MSLESGGQPQTYFEGKFGSDTLTDSTKALGFTVDYDKGKHYVRRVGGEGYTQYEAPPLKWGFVINNLKAAGTHAFIEEGRSACKELP